MLKLLPEKWVTHYEKQQSAKQSLHIVEPSFQLKEDRSVEITFAKKKAIQYSSIFEEQAMILTEDTLKVTIYAFDAQGKPIYEALTNKGHKWHDPATCTLMIA